MELRVLRYFLTIAEEENITRAADILHVTQPTLSRQIMQLEDELGVKLFRRSKYCIKLTEEGLYLKRRAEEILALAEDTAQSLCNKDKDIAGVISIGCTETHSMDEFASRMAEFRKLHPETWFSLRTYEREKVDKDVQFTFFCTIDKVDEPDSIFLAEEELYLTVSPSNPLARLSGVNLSELSSRSFLFADFSNDMQDIQMYYCRLAGFIPDMDNVVGKQVIMLMLLELDEGITLLPKMNNPKLAQIPIRDIHCTRRIYLKKNTQVYETRLAREFERYCIDYFRRMGSGSCPTSDDES